MYIEFNRSAFVTRFIDHTCQRFTLRISVRHHVEDHLIEVFGWTSVGLPIVHAFFSVVIKRRNGFYRRDEPRTLLKDRLTKVAVVNDLVVVRIVGLISQCVVNGPGVAPRYIA